MLKRIICLSIILTISSCTNEQDKADAPRDITNKEQDRKIIQTTFFGSSNGYRTPVFIVDGSGKLQETESFKGTFAPKSTAIEIVDGSEEDLSLLLAIDYGDNMNEGGLCIGVIENNGFMSSDMKCSISNLIQFFLYNNGVTLEEGSTVNPSYIDFVIYDSKESLNPLVDIYSKYLVSLNDNNANKSVPIDSVEVIRASIIETLFQLSDGKAIDSDDIYNFISNNSYGHIEQLDMGLKIDPRSTQSVVRRFVKEGKDGVFIEKLPWVDVYRIFGDQEELGFTEGGFYKVSTDSFNTVSIVGMVGQYFTDDTSLVLKNNEE